MVVGNPGLDIIFCLGFYIWWHPAPLQVKPQPMLSPGRQQVGPEPSFDPGRLCPAIVLTSPFAVYTLNLYPAQNNPQGDIDSLYLRCYPRCLK